MSNMNWIMATAVVLSAAVATGAVKTETIEYKHDDVALEGYWAWDDSSDAARPAVIVVHEWWGLNDYARSRARQLAELGYAAFAVDMYGTGKRAGTRQQAGELAGKLKGDRDLMRKRIQVALDVVRADKRAKGQPVAAIGYCFGGTVVLELARSGADVAGVVSFHGALDTSKPAQADTLKAAVLVCTGADDRSVPMTQVADFVQEMRQAKADCQVVLYGNAVHTFTNPKAGNDPSTNSAYNAKADRRSWEDMQDFLKEVLKLKGDKP